MWQHEAKKITRLGKYSLKKINYGKHHVNSLSTLAQQGMYYVQVYRLKWHLLNEFSDGFCFTDTS